MDKDDTGLDPTNKPGKTTAIWALTPKGGQLSLALSKKLSHATVFLSSRIHDGSKQAVCFDRLLPCVRQAFQGFEQHLFIMATGIVVRTVSGLLNHKTKDPAVVVMDEAGKFAISLISGHIGGANRFSKELGAITGAVPVITTATDVNHVPAIDSIALKKNLFIENPEAIKTINMALITREKIHIFDPYEQVKDTLKGDLMENIIAPDFPLDEPGIYIEDIQLDLSPNVLVLRPRSVSAGIGCNRNTQSKEIKALLSKVLAKYRISPNSLESIASVDLKSDEAGIIELANEMGIGFKVFSKDQLNSVESIQTPSKVVEKHIGVKSVCEAAAILATKNGCLIAPKHSTKNVTVALARKPYMS